MIDLITTYLSEKVSSLGWLKPFIDSDGLLKVCGRPENLANELSNSAKYPIILDSNSNEVNCATFSRNQIIKDLRQW